MREYLREALFVCWGFYPFFHVFRNILYLNLHTLARRTNFFISVSIWDIFGDFLVF